MGAVLAQRRPVTAIFPSRDAMKEKFEDVKKRVSKIVDDKVREMHEERLARQEAREARKAEREQARDEKIAGKIRDKMIREAYALLEITPEEIKKRDEKYNQMSQNNQYAGDSEASQFQQYGAILGGHGAGVRADKRDIFGGALNAFGLFGMKDVIDNAYVTLLSQLGVESAEITAEIFAGVTSLTSLGVIGPVLASVSVGAIAVAVIGLIKLIKKYKNDRKIASANEARDLPGAKAQLERMKKKIEIMTEKLTAKSTEWVEKYKKMKFQKRKFLAELKQEVSRIFKEAGLDSKESTAEQIAVAIQSSVGDEVKPQKQESEVEEVNPEVEEKEEGEAEVKPAGQEAENPEKKLTEEELKRLQENAVTELGG